MNIESSNHNCGKQCVKVNKFLCKLCALIMSFVSLLFFLGSNSYAKGYNIINDNDLFTIENSLLTQMNNPITHVSTNAGSAVFEYDSHNNLVKKIANKATTDFLEKDGKIISVKSPNHSYKLIYDYVDAVETCVGILLDGKYYTFEYEGGNVSLIKDGTTVVCKYDYSPNELIPKICEISSSESGIGHINPIRYQGWFFDTEIEAYYLGQGLFYDANEQLFIENHYSVKANILRSSISEYSTMALTPGEVNTITAQYTTLMNDSSYGSTNCPSYVSTQEYNRGVRWYASLSQIEIVARCIYAENNRKDRLNDRIAETIAIINRINYYSKNAYEIVTADSQFSTICGSGNVDPNSWPAKSKNNVAWQQATLLACIIYYGRKNITDISYFYTMPN